MRNGLFGMVAIAATGCADAGIDDWADYRYVIGRSPVGDECIRGWGEGDPIEISETDEDGRFTLLLGLFDTLECTWVGSADFVCDRYRMSDVTGSFAQGCEGYSLSLTVDRVDGCENVLGAHTTEPSPAETCIEVGFGPIGTFTPD
ncbi:MAG: hypothetical protein H6737_13305 [Alphaproteobacteria bacterium]|nr:hypothetical protein [Alphaproteobacteria bacterium]